MNVSNCIHKPFLYFSIHVCAKFSFMKQSAFYKQLNDDSVQEIYLKLSKNPKTISFKVYYFIPKYAGQNKPTEPPKSAGFPKAPTSAVKGPKSAKKPLKVESELGPPPKYQPPPSPKPRPPLQDARPAQTSLLYGEPTKSQPKSRWGEKGPERDPNRLNSHLQVILKK